MSPKNHTLNTKLDARLAGYAALAGIALSGAAMSTADATIIAVTNFNFAIPNNIDGVYLNVITGNTAVGNAGYDINPYNNGAGLTFFSAAVGGVVANGTTSGTSQAISLLFGGAITPAQTYLTGQAVGTQFQNTGQSYVGFRFQNEGTGVLNYGWALIDHAAGSGTNLGFPATIVSYAYQNDGTGITAGQVPEPTTTALLGVLAAGALGVRAWRRRKAA